MNEISLIVNLILSVLSFLLAGISVVMLILSLRQNKEILKLNEKQINEMREEHHLSMQPLLTLHDVKFQIDRPRLYYTPPRDEYSFQSQYHVKGKIKNVISAPAICVDYYGILSVCIDGVTKKLMSPQERINVISESDLDQELDIFFVEGQEAHIYNALRNASAEELPKLEIIVTYKNTCGGYFKCSHHYYVAPQEDNDEQLRQWHTRVISSMTEVKEEIAALRKMKGKKEWNTVFDKLKKQLDEEMGEPENKLIEIHCREEQQKATFGSLNEAEYEKLVSQYHYGRYVHRTSSCNKKIDQEKE